MEDSTHYSQNPNTARMRPILTPEQASTFEKKIEGIRSRLTNDVMSSLDQLKERIARDLK